MRTLFASLAIAVAIAAGSIGTASTAEAGYYRYSHSYKPYNCYKVVKYTHWGQRLFHVCR
jgi:purine-cytosine permease-like protein